MKVYENQLPDDLLQAIKDATHDPLLAAFAAHLIHAGKNKT